VTKDEIRRTVLRLLGEVAPEVEFASILPDLDLRAQVDLDSFDLLRLLVKLKEVLRVDVPEGDYRQLRTLNQAVDYLADRVPA
jgi:acyl carrier protein